MSLCECGVNQSDPVVVNACVWGTWLTITSLSCFPTNMLATQTHNAMPCFMVLYVKLPTSSPPTEAAHLFFFFLTKPEHHIIARWMLDLTDWQRRHSQKSNALSGSPV